ncbi:MAG: GNAT family N-acetyltransferase, partial [Erythrobacter sp.]
MDRVQLETERLVLRTPCQEDVDLHMLHLNTPAAMRFLGGVKNRQEIVEKTAKSIALQAKEGFSFLYMFEKATGEMVGHCGLKRVDSKGAKNMGDFEMGWVVREDRWQRGYASEAVCEVLHWAFVT